jgi:syringomycin synthetase protein SyrE
MTVIKARPVIDGNTTIGRSSIPLAPCQRDVWQDHRAYPDQAHLTIGGCAFLHGPVSAPLMQASAQAISAECTVLRLAIDPQDGSQSLLEKIDVDFRFLDFSDHPDPVAAIRAHWQQMASHPIPLSPDRAPWFLLLSKASDTLYGLMPLFHHAIMDGYGSSVFVRRLADHYMALDRGTPLPPLDDPGYEAFIADGLAYENGPALQRDLDNWQQQFPSLPPPLLPSLARDHSETINGGALAPAHLESQALPRALYQLVEDSSRALGSTPFHLCVAALAILLAAQTGQRDLVIAVPTLNRAGRLYRQTPGLFAGLLPLRLEVSLADSAADLIRQVGQRLRTAYRHRRVPLTRLGQHLGLLGQGRERMFDVIFSYESLSYACSFGDARLTGPRQLFSGTARYPLGVTLCDFADDQDLELMFEASSAHLSAATAARWGRRLQHILRSLCESPDAALSTLSLLPDSEQQALLTLGQGPALADQPTSVFASILQAAHQTPQATAVRWAGTPWTYQTLFDRAAQIAQALRHSHSGSLDGQVVALHLTPCPDLLAAMLAVIGLGAAFLPLDCEAPLAYRLSRLNDSAASALIADGSDHDICAAVDQRRPVVRLDRLPAPSTAPLAFSETPAANSIAYILFTSGSSGAPKAVAVSHAALTTRLSHLADLWQIGADDCGGAIARPTFDPSLIALLMPLMRGGTVALPERWRMGATEMADFVSRHRVTVAPLVPTTLAMLRDGLRESGQPHALRIVCCGGESLSPALAQSFQDHTGAWVDNLYGPTEATIYATRWPCPRGTSHDAPWPTVLPIGQPAAGTSVRLLDAQGGLVPWGSSGEICLGGAGLAQGYAGAPELTQARFITFTAAESPPERLYRTGDVGRWDDSGALQFLGRQDRQIKINGQRIEPGEIEAVLCADPAVSTAIVESRGQNCARRLHGWVISNEPNQQALSTRLLDAIAEHLPLHMTLASLTVVDNAPLTSSGKIDIAALPDPPAAAAARGPRNDSISADEPTTPLERELAALWCAALALEPAADGSCSLGLHDNLFTLGGDSLSAMAVLTGLERLVGPGLPLSLLVRHPTLASQVRALGDALSHRAIRLARRHPPSDPTAAASAPLFIAASGHGDALRFRCLADALGGAHDVFMLQPPLAGSAEQDRAPTFDLLAATYADLILATLQDTADSHQAPPPVIIGFSLGGVAALETARTLGQHGHVVERVILIDTTYPYASPNGEKVWRAFAKLVRSLGLHQRFRPLWRWIAMLEDQGLAWQLKALHSYRPTAYNGQVELLTSSGLRPLSLFLFTPWKKLLGSHLRRHALKGLHGSVLRPGRVEALAAMIRGFHR